MLTWLDAEIEAARQRVYRNISRRLSFANRSAGQKRRWVKRG
jgi:hypothetical protein